MIEGTVNTAFECFTLGLNSEIATQMIGKISPNLEAAINTAIICERHVQQRKELKESRTVVGKEYIAILQNPKMS